MAAFFMALNPQNLKRFSSEEARRNGKKGAEKSAQKRRERKTFKELLKIALEMKSPTGKTNAEEIVASMIRKAQDGDVKAFEAVRDTIGEKPKDEVDLTTQEKTPEGMIEMYQWLKSVDAPK